MTSDVLNNNNIHRSAITLWPPAYYCVGPPFGSRTALTRGGMDSTRPLKVCCGVWHQDVSSRSFKSWKLRGGASMGRTCLSNTPHRCSIALRSGEFGGQVNTLKSSLCSSNHFCSVAGRIILLKEATAIRECSLHEEVSMAPDRSAATRPNIQQTAVYFLTPF